MRSGYSCTMADATIDRNELAKVRRLVEELGLYAAAEKLNVHASTLNIILSGRQPRAGTVALLKTSLPKVKA